jgi:hypothetical protein
MFRPIRFSALFSLLALSLPAAGMAAPVQASPRAQAEALVVRPLTLIRTDDLDFGALVVTSGGTATINPNTGALAVTGGLVPMAGPVSPARFAGAATRLALIVIRVPTSPVTIRRQGGTETLQVSNFTLNGSAIRIVGNAAFEFAVGARLTVPAGTVDGLYTGDINVTVEYF